MKGGGKGGLEGFEKFLVVWKKEDVGLMKSDLEKFQLK
jgi:hypothetical protein